MLRVRRRPKYSHAPTPGFDTFLPRNPAPSGANPGLLPQQLAGILQAKVRLLRTDGRGNHRQPQVREAELTLPRARIEPKRLVVIVQHNAHRTAPQAAPPHDAAVRVIAIALRFHPNGSRNRDSLGAATNRSDPPAPSKVSSRNGSGSSTPRSGTNTHSMRSASSREATGRITELSPLSVSRSELATVTRRTHQSNRRHHMG